MPARGCIAVPRCRERPASGSTLFCRPRPQFRLGFVVDWCQQRGSTSVVRAISPPVYALLNPIGPYSKPGSSPSAALSLRKLSPDKFSRRNYDPGYKGRINRPDRDRTMVPIWRLWLPEKHVKALASDLGAEAALASICILYRPLSVPVVILHIDPTSLNNQSSTRWCCRCQVFFPLTRPSLR